MELARIEEQDATAAVVTGDCRANWMFWPLQPTTAPTIAKASARPTT